MHPLFSQFKNCLLGRLKTLVLSSISKSLEEFPSQRELFSTIMEEWRKNASYGRILFHLIHCVGSHTIEAPTKMSARQVGRVLALMGKYKPITRLFIEAKLTLNDPPVGILLLGHSRPNGQPGYYATIFSEDSFPNVGCVSIVPYGKDPARIEILGNDGWTRLSPKQASTATEVRVLLKFIWNYLSRKSTKLVSISDVRVDWDKQPPLDSEFMRRIRPAVNGSQRISLAWAPSDRVSPFDIDFCFKLNERDVDTFVPHVTIDPPLAPVVYWNGKSFIMSDDYHTYCAYRKIGASEMRLAILGKFPFEAARLEKEGGSELLLPFVITPVEKMIGETAAFKHWSLDQKLRRRNQREIPGELIATWLMFADMLAHDGTTERQLHNFLRDHPIAIFAYANEVESEISLGNQFRIDLLLRSSGVREEITLIELEHHRHRIFTAEGRQSHMITHATQQVRDWIQWLGENPTHPLALSLGGVKPAGLVVIGRSESFGDRERRLLANVNENSSVKVITYDELLDRFRDLILARCDDERL